MRAVRPVTMALIACVVPWMRMSPRRVVPRGRCRPRPPPRHHCRGRRDRVGGVVRALNIAMSPPSSATMRSVNVPPVSTAKRILCLFGDHIALRTRSALARALQELCEGGMREALPAIYLVLAAASFGATFCLNKLAAEAGMPPLAYAFWQSTLSGLGLLAIAAVRGCRVPLGAGALKTDFLVGVLGLGLPGALLTFTAPHLPAGLVTLVLALSPPLTFLMAVAARQQKFRWWGLLGVAFGFAGMLVIAGPGSGVLPSADGVGWFALCLIAPVLYAMANVAASIFRRQRRRGGACGRHPARRGGRPAAPGDCHGPARLAANGTGRCRDRHAAGRPDLRRLHLAVP